MFVLSAGQGAHSCRIITDYVRHQGLGVCECSLGCLDVLLHRLAALLKGVDPNINQQIRPFCTKLLKSSCSVSVGCEHSAGRARTGWTAGGNTTLSELQSTGLSADPLLEHSLKNWEHCQLPARPHPLGAVVSAGLSMVEFQGIDSKGSSRVLDLMQNKTMHMSFRWPLLPFPENSIGVPVGARLPLFLTHTRAHIDRVALLDRYIRSALAPSGRHLSVTAQELPLTSLDTIAMRNQESSISQMMCARYQMKRSTGCRVIGIRWKLRSGQFRGGWECFCMHTLQLRPDSHSAYYPS